MESFLTFSASYFDYIGRAFFHGLPTLLAKILGLFRIGYRNSAAGKSMRMDVLVMGAPLVLSLADRWIKIYREPLLRA
jgi:1-phosphatidylinositol-3-phosphate 5-kinase